MKRSSALVLRAVVVLIGLGALAFMLWEPHLEGRNANASLFDIYFKDPFLAYAYIGSLPLYAALCQAFMLLGYAEKGEKSSRRAIRALRTIKYCGITLVAFVLGAEVYFFLVQRGKEDIAGGVFIGLLMLLISASISAAAAVLEVRLQSEKTAGSGS